MENWIIGIIVAIVVGWVIYRKSTGGSVIPGRRGKNKGPRDFR